MKQYVIDELRPQDYEKLKTYLETTFGASGIEGIYRIPVAKELLTEIQQQHQEECGPFFMSAELEFNRIACELLVRCQNRIRCNCISYASEKQRSNFLSD